MTESEGPEPDRPDWNALRARFPALEGRVYLNTAGGGPLCTEAWQAAREYLDRSLALGDVEWDHWLARVEEVRSRLAGMLGAADDEIAFLSNASAGVNLTAEIFAGEGEGQGAVLGIADDFPSVSLPWLVRGRPVRFVESGEDGVVALEAVERALAPEGDCRLVAVSHVQYRTGFRFDLDELARLCLERRVPLVVDATQSFGVTPIDLGATPVSALVFSGYKWANAGYGIAPLFVRKGVLEPRGLPSAGWRSNREPYGLENRELDLTGEARGLELGHPPFGGVVALGGALEALDRIGIAAIEGRVSGLVEEVIRGLDTRGIPVVSPRERGQRAGIVMAAIAEPARVARELRERDVFVSARGPALRISAHYYNDRSDVDRFFAACDEVGIRPASLGRLRGRERTDAE